MRKLLNTLYILDETAYLTLDGENIVCKSEQREPPVICQSAAGSHRIIHGNPEYTLFLCIGNGAKVRFLRRRCPQNTICRVAPREGRVS